MTFILSLILSISSVLFAVLGLVLLMVIQSKLDSIFIGMEGVTRIADDMVIAGRYEMEHDRNFLGFMEKCMSNNFTVNAEKIQFCYHYWEVLSVMV